MTKPGNKMIIIQDRTDREMGHLFILGIKNPSRCLENLQPCFHSCHHTDDGKQIKTAMEKSVRYGICATIVATKILALDCPYR